MNLTDYTNPRACRVYTLDGMKPGKVWFPDADAIGDAPAYVKTDDGADSAFVPAPLALMRVETGEPIYFC